MLKILELFGGVGSPRVAFRDLGIPVKSIDYVEIDEKAVRSYNAMFADQLEYKTQDVCGWNLRPDILIHGSPCQDVSIAGKQQGADKNSGTRSSLMWETINIIRNMGEWKPRVVIWENVKGVLSKRMNHNFRQYITEMTKMGYINNYRVLNAIDFGLPQKRERVFTISQLRKYGLGTFDFEKMEKQSCKSLSCYLEKEADFTPYMVTQPSIIRAIGKTGVISRATVINDFCYTITERQDRLPNAGVIKLGDNYRFLTERECWRLQGYSDDDFDNAAKVNSKRTLYKQAGNSIPVPIFKSIFSTLLGVG